MSSKQDRQGARTAADLERRYRFGKTFKEFMGAVEDVERDAQEAQETADQAKESFDGLDQMKIFNLLTKNGEKQGIVMGEDGKIYINAEFLVAGIIASVNGAVKLDLSGNKLEISIPPTAVYYRRKSIIFNEHGLMGYGDSDLETGKDLHNTLAISPAPYTEHPGDTEGWFSRIQAIDADLLIDAYASSLPNVQRAVRIGKDENSSVKIMGKTVRWQIDGDRYYLVSDK